MFKSISRTRLAPVLSCSLLLVLGGCSSMASNRDLESIHQPMVKRSNYIFDISVGPDGIPLSEQRRLAGWFEAMAIRYGDRITVDDPAKSSSAFAAVEAVAGRYGILVSSEDSLTSGEIGAGKIRVILTRSVATVPGCPDWSVKVDTNFSNGASSNYGCAVNSNLAAMVADPEHLLHGARSDATRITAPTKAIDAYRTQAATGGGGLTAVSSKGGN